MSAVPLAFMPALLNPDEETTLSARPALLLTGATGLVGSHLYRLALADYRVTLAVHRRAPWFGLRRGDRTTTVDLGRPGAGHRLVEAADPEVIVHCAAWSALGSCESDPQGAREVNTRATRELAEAARRSGMYLVFFSTDQVFDGDGAPYREEDPPSPVTHYGRTKVEAEESVRTLCADGVILRLALVLGLSRDRQSGALDMLRPRSPAQPVTLFDDEWRTPLSVHCLARIVKALLRERPCGTLHTGGVERVHRLELGRRVVRAFGWHQVALEARSRREAGTPRPRDLSLDLSLLCEWGLPRPLALDQALAEIVQADTR